MANQNFPSVNGDECSWADIVISCLVPGAPTFPLVDAEGIKWSSKVEVGSTKGTSGGRTMKTTAGTETTDGSVTLNRSGLAQLQSNLEAAAVAAGLVRADEVIISGVRFDILIQHSPLGDVRIYTTKLSGCRYLADGNDMKQGNDADLVEVTLNPIRIARKSDTGKWLTLR